MSDEARRQLTAAQETAHCWNDPSTEKPEFLTCEQLD